MRIILFAVYLLLVLSPLSSYGKEPETLDEAVKLVEGLRAKGASHQEVAEVLSSLTDKRIRKPNTKEGESLKNNWYGPIRGGESPLHTEFIDKVGKLDLESQAKWAWDKRYGQCSEISAINYYILTKAGYKNVKILENPGGINHQWVVLGMRENADPSKPGEWGDDAYVVDGWIPAKQREEGRPVKHGLNPKEASEEKYIGDKGQAKPGYATWKFGIPKQLSPEELQWMAKNVPPDSIDDSNVKDAVDQEKKRKEDEAKRQAEQKKKDDEAKQKEEEAKRKAEEQKRKEDEAKRQAETEQQRRAALDAALKQAQALIAAAQAAVGRVQAVSGAVQGAVTAASSASSTAGAAEGAGQQAKGAADAARSACAKVVSEGVIDAARARAEAAASEVGTLYQEVVNLANETCQAAAQVQQASNAGARRILTTKMEGLATRAQSRAASAQTALRRAQTEAGQATRQNAARQAALAQSNAAKAALTTARGQVSAGEGVMNSYETTITGAQGQVGTAQSEVGQVEQYKRAALGILAPFSSEPAAQALIAVINGIAPPAIDGLDQQLQTAMTTVQQARTRVKAVLDQLSAWEGSVAACGGLAPTDSLAQAATAAASAAELFLPKVTEAARRAAQCAGSVGAYNPTDKIQEPGMGRKPSDIAGANQAVEQRAGGGRQPGDKGDKGGLGTDQATDQQAYRDPPQSVEPTSPTTPSEPSRTLCRDKQGDVVPCDWLYGPGGGWGRAPAGPEDAVRVPHDTLRPDPGLGDKPGGKSDKPMGPQPNPGTTAQPTGKPDKPMGPKPNPGPTDQAAGKPGKPMGPGPACGPMTSCTCKGGGKGHIPCDKAKGACHCGAE